MGVEVALGVLLSKKKKTQRTPDQHISKNFKTNGVSFPWEKYSHVPAHRPLKQGYSEGKKQEKLIREGTALVLLCI